MFQIFNNPYYKSAGKLYNKYYINNSFPGEPELIDSDDSSYVTGQVMHINGGQYKG